MTKPHPEFIVRSAEPLNGGPAAARQSAAFVTPSDVFFVRNHGLVPSVDASTHRLEVGGLVADARPWSLPELETRFSRVEITSTLACAGQRRQEMAAVAPIPGELPWGAEAVSTATWSGWRLADVLAAAGLADGAAHVACEGLDEVERGARRFAYGASIPLEKALSPEVLLADRMNGAPLPPEHGHPLRLVVPGYIGARQVKWLARIEVRGTSSENYFQRVAYRRYPREMTPATHDPSRGVELTDLEVNCTIAEPADGATVYGGFARVRGVAYSGGGAAVASVRVSGDGGATWVEAELEPLPDGVDPAWTWRLYACTVPLGSAVDGLCEVVACATDAHGAEQPADGERLWNFKGYMNNAWPRVRVRVG